MYEEYDTFIKEPKLCLYLFLLIKSAKMLHCQRYNWNSGNMWLAKNTISNVFCFHDNICIRNCSLTDPVNLFYFFILKISITGAHRNNLNLVVMFTRVAECAWHLRYPSLFQYVQRTFYMKTFLKVSLTSWKGNDCGLQLNNTWI